MGRGMNGNELVVVREIVETLIVELTVDAWIHEFLTQKEFLPQIYLSCMCVEYRKKYIWLRLYVFSFQIYISYDWIYIHK